MGGGGAVVVMLGGARVTAPKRGRGRPQLAEADRRTRLPVLLTAAERAEIDAAAGDAGASTWLRGVGLRAARARTEAQSALDALLAAAVEAAR